MENIDDNKNAEPWKTVSVFPIPILDSDSESSLPNGIGKTLLPVPILCSKFGITFFLDAFSNGILEASLISGIRLSLIKVPATI